MICQNHEKVPNIIFLIKVAQRFYPKRTSLATTPITYPHSLISNKLLDNSCAQEPATSLGWKQWPDITSRSGLVLGESNGHPLQYSCLKKNPMDRGAWLAAVHGVAKSWTQLSDFTFTFHFHALEKEMATHSSVLAGRIPGTGEPWWAAVYGVAQSRTWLKLLSNSSILQASGEKDYTALN